MRELYLKAVLTSLIASICLCTTTKAQSLPSTWTDGDIGSVGSAGSASFSNGAFTIMSSGHGIYSTADGFHFVYQALNGDGTIVARVVSMQNNDSYEQAGVMIRETLAADAANASMTFQTYQAGNLDFVYRAASSSNATVITSPGSTPSWVKLTRSGSSFSAFSSFDGTTWTQVGSTTTISMAQNVYIGVVASSDANSVLDQAALDNVSVSSSTSSAPTVMGISPTAGLPGTQVTISGSGFGSPQGSSSVYLGSSALTVSSWSDTSIVATLPSGVSSGPMGVSVAPSMNFGNATNFTVLPNDWVDGDIGSVGIGGTSTFANNVFTVQGAGDGVVSTTADSIHFLYRPISSTNGTIVARILSGGSSNSEAGIMIRQSLSPGSPNISMLYRAQDFFFVFDRGTLGASTSNASSLSAPAIPYWIKLVCSSGSLNAYISRDGISWTPNGSTISIALGSSLYVGLAVTSQNSSASVIATFDNVSIGSSSSPAPVISSLSATSGQIGSPITITGSGFGLSQGASTVLLNGTAATINSWSDTSIAVTVPTGATSGPVVVSVAPNMNDSNPMQYNVTIDPLPTGWVDQDLGSATVSGSATYINNTFTVKGAGETIGSGAGTSDSFHFAYTSLSGDGSIVARLVTFSGYGAQAGVMIRDGLNPTSANAFVPFVPANGNPFYFYRPSPGGQEDDTSINTFHAFPCWFKLARKGNDFTSYVSSDGVNWVQAGWPQALNLGSSVYVGLAVNSGSPNNLATATFDNVSVTSTSAPGPVISSISATTGSVGSQVTINGSHFSGTQGSSAVVLNDVPVTINTWSDTSISITIPSGATSGYLTVSLAPSMNNSNPVTFTVTSQALPGGWLDRDIGTVGLTGNASHSGGVFTVQAGGTGISGTSDAFHYVYQPLVTDGTIVVRVASASGTWGSQAGVVVRETLDALSPETAVLAFDYSGSFNIYANFRALSGAGTSSGSLPSNPSVAMPYWMKVTRTANTFTAYASGDGAAWTQLGSPQTITTAQQVYVGFGVASTSTNNFSSATFDNVGITVGSALPNPTVTSITPTTGAPGTSVTINGSGFGTTQGTPGTLCNNDACFNGSTASTITSWSDTQIVATVPDDATSGPVAVTVGGITSSGPQFTLKFVAQVTDSLGNVSTYSAAPSGGLWTMSDLQGSGCSSCSSRGNLHNQFDSNGHRVWSVDALGTTTSYRYDSSNNVIEQLTPLNSSANAITQYAYNGFGEITSVTDALNHTTTNAYDTHGNLLSVTTPTGSVTHFAYNSLGQLTQITDPLSNVTTLTYTTAGLIATIKDAQNNVTTYAYDAHGNRTSVTDALSNQTTFAYDAGDRLTTITYPDSTTTTFGYDYRGRRTSVTDQNGKTTTYTYDDADRTTSMTDAASHTTSYGYDTENNLTSITDANGHETSFTYDAFGRVTQTNFPSSLIETYAYDANNNLTSKTDRKGQTIGYIYDALNRLIQKNYPNSTGVEYVYDLVGKIKSVTDPTGTYAFAYDNDGRMIGTTTNYSFLPSRTFTTSYGYDAASNRTSFTDPENGSTLYVYDTLKRLTTLTPPSAFTTGSFGFTYDALSRRTQMTRPNNVTTNYAYDTLSRLSAVLHQMSGTTIDGVAYTSDNAGHRTSKTDQRIAVSTGYGYDATYQLTSAVQSGTTTESYTYDPVGNRTTSLGISSYSIDSSNHLTSTSAVGYTYDANGNTLSTIKGSNTTTYAWDYENRLTSVTLPGSGGTISFKYDPFGRRIYKSSSSVTSVYAYDKMNLVEETDGSGTVAQRYVQGLKIDEQLAMLRSGSTSFYEADGLGTTTSLSGSTGSLVQTYTFDSFGNQTAATGSVINPFRYTGREWDDDVNLQFSRRRYYDPNVGRFLSEDPLGFKAGPDFYVYVDNEPTRYRDPLGLLRDCSAEYNDCMSDCWNKRRLPWPRGCGSDNPKVRRWSRYRFCEEKCQAAYLECEASNEANKLVDACAQNPAACVAVGVGIIIILAQPETAPILGPVIARAAQ